MSKCTKVKDRVFVDNTVVGHAIPRCMLWDGGLGVQTSIVKMHKGMDLGDHVHDTWVQVMVLSGKTLCTLGDQINKPGDFYFVEPGSVHNKIALEDSEVLIIKAMPNIQYQVGQKPA